MVDSVAAAALPSSCWTAFRDWPSRSRRRRVGAAAKASVGRGFRSVRPFGSPGSGTSGTSGTSGVLSTGVSGGVLGGDGVQHVSSSALHRPAEISRTFMDRIIKPPSHVGHQPSGRWTNETRPHPDARMKPFHSLRRARMPAEPTNHQHWSVDQPHRPMVAAQATRPHRASSHPLPPSGKGHAVTRLTVGSRRGPGAHMVIPGIFTPRSWAQAMASS